MKKIIFLITAVFILFLSCERPPEEEMNRAIEALNRAENDYNAVNYGGNLLDRARSALTLMHEEASSKRFDSARNFAAEVINFSDRAISEGRLNADRARSEAANLVLSLAQSLHETETAINSSRVSNMVLDYNELDSLFDSAKSEHETAEQNINDGRFQDALNRAHNVRSLLSFINTRISEAVRAVSGKE